MSKSAHSDQLRTAIDNHLSETEHQISRLEQIFELLGESPRGQKCEGMHGLIEEGKSLLREDANPDVLDAGIIVAAQKVEHYEIAGYGAVCEYARMMGHTEALQLLQQTLEEEKNADQLLNELAEGGINALADGEGDGEARADGEADRTTGRANDKANGGKRHAAPRRGARATGRAKARS